MTLEKFVGLPNTKKLTILVYGWYGQGNLGDDLFVDAFKQIFPTYDFIFTSGITYSNLQNVDAVFFGGGSFLEATLKVDYTSTFDLLKEKPIFYIGVGGETNIHPMHEQLLYLAKLIALRSYANYDQIKSMNSQTIVIPDLVYALHAPPTISKIPNSILFIPNVVVVPKWDSDHWKHASWDYFKIETAQCLDAFLNKKYTVKFLPFCINKQLNDSYAAAEIINRMKGIREDSILEKPVGIKATIDLISKYRIVVTQRFHGTILANIAQTPCLTIHHHDKLKGNDASYLSYYNSSKNTMLNQMDNLLFGKVSSVLPIDRNIFTSLKQKVENALCRDQE